MLKNDFYGIAEANIENISQIIEIGFDIRSQEEYDFLDKLLAKCGFSYYIQPMRNPPWASLEDLECACEGK